MGSQHPTASVVPDYAYSEIDDLVAVNAQGGLRLFDWQRTVDTAWVARTDDGKWACPTAGLSVARQNGKSLGTIEARANYGMLILAETVVYTAHLQKTATETFEDMAAFFDSPKLRKYVKDIRTALGREQIILKNGARIKYLARTRNGGRGQHGDLLIFDEAQELTDEQQGSFLPCISASSNPQTIYAGTPPDENADGTVFRRIRGDALAGETKKSSWHEWSVSEIGDVTDRARWAAANPSMGITIQESTIETECEQMAPDRFARERLGWWNDNEAVIENVIDVDDWDACLTKSPAMDGITVYAVKFSPDGAVGTLSACVKPKDGIPHIEVVETRSMADGIGWFYSWLAARKGKAAQIVIDGGGNAQTLTDMLEPVVGKRVLIRPTAQQMAGACSHVLNSVIDRTVTHFGQKQLDDSATKTARRAIGKGWGFETTEHGDSTLIESCALALWGALTTKRDPSRVIRIL